MAEGDAAMDELFETTEYVNEDGSPYVPSNLVIATPGG